MCDILSLSLLSLLSLWLFSLAVSWWEGNIEAVKELRSRFSMLDIACGASKDFRRDMAGRVEEGAVSRLVEVRGKRS
jgi:hypothetical protein